MSMGSKALKTLVAGVLVGSGAVADAAVSTVSATVDSVVSQVSGLGGSGFGPSVDGRAKSYLMIQTEVDAYLNDFNAALFYFDLSAYAGKTVTANGTFTIYAGQATGPLSADVYQVSSNWLLAPGQSTYNNLAWEQTVPGTLLTSGVIPNNTNQLTSRPTAVSFTIPQATLQSWIDSPDTNYGLAVMQNYGLPNYNFSTVAIGSIVGNQSALLAFDSVAVPEPASIGALGICGLLLLRRKS